MTAQALYRKWRSRSFGDILGQDHVIRTLRNAIRHDRVAHAYLFTGPRGTGKTSTARVMAKAVNCLNPQDGSPCGECEMCLSVAAGRSPDVIEIDGASNNSIDDIRELRERAAYTPAEGRFKVYIIDEVHRLSPNAFDGLLKTLEEPPPHVLFIFASTEPHKVPMTILSRCQQFDFHKIGRETMTARLREVAAEEGVTLDDAGIRLITQQAGGSLRDAIGTLDQVRAFAGDDIASDAVRAAIGLGRPEVVAGISEAIIDGKVGSALELIHDATVQGIDPRTLSRQIIEYWRELLLSAAGSTADDNLDPMLTDAAAKHTSRLTTQQVVAVLKALTEQVIEPRLSVSPELPLEIGVTQSVLVLRAGATDTPLPSGDRETTPSVLREEVTHNPSEALPATRENQGSNQESVDIQASSLPEMVSATGPVSESVLTSKGTESTSDVAQVDATQGDSTQGDATTRLTNAWPTVIEAARSRSLRLQGLLRDVNQIEVTETEAMLGFRHPFHREQSDKPDNRSTIEQLIEELVGIRLRVRCIKSSQQAVASEDDDGFISDAERMLRSIHAQQFRSSGPDA